MPRLNEFQIKIETGDPGLDESVHFAINGFKIPFENVKGGTGPGQTFEAGFEVNSHPHGLTLVGPAKGKWNIKKMSLEYNVDGMEPYTIHFGEVTLDETTEANIWQDPPLPAFDV